MLKVATGEEQVTAKGHLQPTPAGGQDTQEMATEKEEYVAVQRPQPGDHTLGAGAHVRGTFATVTAFGSRLHVLRPGIADQLQLPLHRARHAAELWSDLLVGVPLHLPQRDGTQLR